MSEDEVPTELSFRGVLPRASALQSGLSTIRPQRGDDRSLDSLPTLTLRNEGAPKPYLELLGELGEGGTAVVHLAEQIPLGRRVAVKSLKTDGQSVALLHEARITGRLEHPNVVPVYTLGQNADGVPMLVMKRVEGRSWRAQLVADWREGGLPVPALRRHVEILMQVCNAVSFAHSKGVVHRDLKPENVMLGAFGEVYVLDWGIAVATEDGPRVLHADELAGTPAYMAPEMASGELAAIGPHTDVYLLGAILHELLVGAPRHTGRGLGEIIASVLSSRVFSYPATVPAELVAVCLRATAFRPAQRFPSVEALREALGAYLSHASSRALAHEAEQRIAAVEAGEADRERIAECRFAVRLALQEWPENPEALACAQRLQLALARREIARGELAAAEELLADVDAPEDLLAALEELRARRVAERRELARLQRLEFDSDLDVGSRWRATVVLVLACGFALIPIVAWWGMNEGWYPPPEGEIVILPVFAALFFAAAAWWKRAIFLRNAANRRLVACLIATFACLLLHRLIALRHGVPVREIFGQEVSVLFAIATTMTICLDRRLVWSALCFFVSGVVIALWPAASMPALGLGVGAALFSMWKVWR